MRKALCFFNLEAISTTPQVFKKNLLLQSFELTEVLAFVEFFIAGASLLLLRSLSLVRQESALKS